MHDDHIRKHIEATAARGQRETSRLTSGMMSSCWPGGAADRSEPAALGWVRRWRPVTVGAELPVCSCARGRCFVCN
jgi:hypothetical protein